LITIKNANAATALIH